MQGFNPPVQVWPEGEHDPDSPSFFGEMNFRNPPADAVPAGTLKGSSVKRPSGRHGGPGGPGGKVKSPSKLPFSSPRKKKGGSGGGDDLDLAAGPGISLSSISDLTQSLQKLNSDLLNGSILKS